MLFRNRRLARLIACFFLIEVVSSLAAPTVTLAMMGPNQMEFSSYEPAGSTDMVNLSTGDLSYSVPILDIPGPERGFSLPLTYKAGIQLEQEASWVGLGWSLNAGAVVRSVNGYPDDAANEPVHLSEYKFVEDETNYNFYFGLYQQSFNSATGSSGSVDLLGLASLNWDKDGIKGGDLVGIGYQAGKGWDVDVVRMVMAGVTIATLGAGSAATLAARVGINVATSLAVEAAVSNIAYAFGAGRAAGVTGFNNQPSVKANTYNYGSVKVTKYKVQYNTATDENAYGSLYFGNMSRAVSPANLGIQVTNPNAANGPATTSAGCFNASRNCTDEGNQTAETAADIYQPVFGTENYTYASKHPISIAHDNFNVMGEASSGVIRPYRLDVGSVAYPKQGYDNCDDHSKCMVTPFLDGAHDHYKVGFRYENSLSNSYEYHNYLPGVNASSGVGIEVASNQQALTLLDPQLGASAARTEPLRTGLAVLDAAGPSSRQLVQGKHTVWYSNQEIEQMAAYASAGFTGYPNGFVNFATPQPMQGATGTDAFRHSLPPSGIGAFAVTTEDGSTYHYSLPVYHFKTYSETNEQQVTIPNSSPAQYTRTTGAPNSSNLHGGYATTWLLTAITSADYIDRNHSGTVDAGDWGGWVRFDYGRFSSAYKWRVPYTGGSYSESSTNFLSFQEGLKETYYLNSISTRTHTALFIKSIRQDGRGHYDANSTFNARFNINNQFPAASLRLDEVVLLDNATWANLQNGDGTRPALSFANSSSNIPSAAGDDWQQVLDTQDFTADATGSLRSYLEANALKRTRFNYGYDLCRGTPNSFACQYGQVNSLPPTETSQASASYGGKLTLKSISFFGPTLNQVPTKIIPDFTFSYEDSSINLVETNPNYEKEKWDAFGMYQPSGTFSTDSHKPASIGYEAPWTLRSITSPLGGITTIKYERDEYAHVSEYGIKSFSTSLVSFDFSSNRLTLFVGDAGPLDLQTIFPPGSRIPMSGIATFKHCTPTNGQASWTDITKTVREQPFKVINVLPAPGGVPRTWYVTVKADLTIVGDGSLFTLQYPYPPLCSNPLVCSVMSLTGLIPCNTRGGDIRVAAITTTENETNRSYSVRYVYSAPVATDTAQTSGSGTYLQSTGVLAKEPAFLNKNPHDIEQFFDYPTTPVVYGQVSVLRGPLLAADGSDWRSKEVYSFFTPYSGMINESQNVITRQYTATPASGGSKTYQATFTNNIVDIHTGLIGRPKAVQTYNRQGHNELHTEFEYAEQIQNADKQPNQGHYTEGVMTNELLQQTNLNTNRTTKHYYPTVLIASHSTRNGVSIDNNSNLFDFYTGQVVDASFRNSRNQTYHSRTIPAYTVLPGMGPKGLAGTNSHMLLQAAAQYTLKEKTGVAYNPVQFLQTAAVLSAGIQTWQNNWTNYRAADATGAYQDVAGQPLVWRQAATYAWQSPLLDSDGSFKDFVPFVWTGTPNAHWLRASETVRYDHYSHALESRDVNGHYATQKTGYDQTQLIASATNARYTELAYSGAEDQLSVGGTTHFSGEVIAGGTPDKLLAHTGLYSNQLAVNQKGFLYQAQVGRDVDLGKTYRVSAWVHANAPQGKLYADLNGSRITEISRVDATAKKAGDWYLLTLLVKVPANATGQMLEFGCINGGGAPANFDDFRVAPLTATVASKLYDPRTNSLLYSLDNDNLYTRYEYTPTGRLRRVYQETLDRPGDNSLTEKKVKEYDFNYARFLFPTWVTTAYRCQTNALGNSTGYEERQVIDVNPLNNPLTPPRWELNGYSPVCL